MGVTQSAKINGHDPYLKVVLERVATQPTRRTSPAPMGAAHIVISTLKPWNFAAAALGILTACSMPRSAHCVEAPTVLVAMDQDVGEDGICHVHYKDVDLTAPCTEIVALMKSDASIPAHAHVAVQASKTARYEQISLLLRSLRDSGYDMKIGYMNSE